MDDTGDSWTFLGVKDEILVTWNVYDGSTNCYDKGREVYYGCTHFNKVVRTLVMTYNYSFSLFGER